MPPASWRRSKGLDGSRDSIDANTNTRIGGVSSDERLVTD
jgi:hypothetical protein